MRTLVQTKNTLISVDENNNLFVFQEPVGITLNQLKAYQEQGFNIGFPFNRINIDDITSSALPEETFHQRGYSEESNISRRLVDFREEFKVSKNLSVAYFYDLTTYVLKSKAIIFTYHNAFDITPIHTSFQEFTEKRIANLAAKARIIDAIYAEMYEPLKGWYVATIEGTAMKHKGNDGKEIASVKVLAESKMDAYNKAINHLQNNPKGNVCSWLSFEEPHRSLIEYVGVWNDQAELEYGN